MLSGREELKVGFSQHVFLYLVMVFGCKSFKTAVELEIKALPSTVRIEKNMKLFL